MRSKLATVTLVGALAAVPAAFAAEATKKVEVKESKATERIEANHESASTSQAALQREAKVPMAEARKIALKRVNGTIESGELEREYGKLIYSFDIRVPHKSGITEVAVNAINGDIVNVHRESAAKEAAEQKQETKEKATASSHH